MAKLHQVLAVSDDISQKSNSISAEAKKTFGSKGEHFEGLTKVYVPYEEGGTKLAPEYKELVTTVRDKLDFTLQSIIDSIDVRATISETNASGTACAELKIGTKTFGTFAATTLLELEKALVNIRQLYGEIPTLDPAKKWSKNDKVANTYVTDKQVTYRSEKIKKALTLAPATDKHPAQVQVFEDDKQVGQYETVWTSGKITPQQKSDLLARIDGLILAVKDARSQANNVDAKNVKLASSLFSYINEGII